MPDLERAGVFDTGPGDRSWLCAWRSDTTIVSSLRARWQDSPEMSELRLDFYTISHADGRRVKHDYSIPVTPPIGLRGRGRSFLCPLVSDGTTCLQRCAVVYRPTNTDYFGCRQCHRLTLARRPRRRMALADLTAELDTAEHELLHASLLIALPRAVERLAAARDAIAPMLRAEIKKTAEVESLIAAAEAARHSPRPHRQQLLRCYTELRRVLREDACDLHNLLDEQEQEALRFEVSLLSASE